MIDWKKTPWCVIVPSLEDWQGVNRIGIRNLLSREEILSLLMIDFPYVARLRPVSLLYQYISLTDTQ